MRTICVFCGSSPGVDPLYMQAAAELGALLARRGLTLVYGGGQLGLMGAVSRAALQGGGRVIGVIPRDMVERGVVNHADVDVRVVGDMHERKAQMAELADAFVTLPGGYGTLEEIFEVITWAQLGYHQKPCGFLNAGGYFDSLRTFLQHVRGQGFIEQANLDMLLWDSSPASLLERFSVYRQPAADKFAAAIKKTGEYNHQHEL
jgi:uncharacterized protein (TIGR00730 family)